MIIVYFLLFNVQGNAIILSIQNFNMSCCEKAKTTLQPLFNHYWSDFDEGRFDKLIEHYHPDAVVIDVGKKGIYGKEAIKEEKLNFHRRTGRAPMMLSNEHYQMTEDYIVYCGDYEIDAERAGTLKGKFSQIWKKTNGKYLILREAYSENPPVP